MIIRNNQPGLYGTEVAFRLQDGIGRQTIWWVCPRSGVASRTWSVCYGRTLPEIFRAWIFESGANGTKLYESPPV